MVRNENEFQQWLDYHSSLNPGVQKWLRELPKTGVDIQGVLDAWERLLKPIDLSTAKRCSDELMAREKQPRYERHAAEIVAIAKAHGFTSRAPQVPTMRDGQPTYKCRDCRDTGKAPIYVVGEELTRSIRMYGSAWAFHRVAMVQCHCQGNGQIRDWIDRGQMVVQRVGPEVFAMLDQLGYAKRQRQMEQAEAVIEAEEAAKRRAELQEMDGPQPITAMTGDDF